MRKLLFLSIFIALFGIISSNISAQEKPIVLTGEVTAVGDNKIALQTKDGAVDVQLAGTTKYKKVSPENPSLAAATDAVVTDVGVGDKIAVTGIPAADKKSMPARTVYLMTKADITKRNNEDQSAWRTRSISGRVTAVSPERKEFTLAVRSAAGEQNVVVSQKLNITYRRYAPDSVKFDDAKNSSFDEIKVGDQVRTLGDKSEDGTTFRAERVVAGSFKTIAGTITAIDAANNQVTIKDIQTNKLITVAVNSNSVLKKFTPEMAQMLAGGMQGGGASGGGFQPPNGGNGQGNIVRPPQPGGQQGQASPNGEGRPGGGMRQGGGMRRGGDIDSMLDRLPTISLADLKAGDQIAFSSSTSADPSRATAIKLVAGVEPFLRARQAAGGRRNGGGGGQDAGFSIPGLDEGIGAP